MFDYINEAFKKLALLNEETFDTSLDGINDLSSFKDQDDAEDLVKIIDPEATTNDDIKDSYIGKVITNCNVCHSHIFENKDDIIVDDEGIVNPDKECPYCGESAGFTIVGEITPYVEKSEQSEEDVPVVTVDGETIPTTEEQVDESVLGTLGLAAGAGLVGGAASAIGKHATSKFLGASDEAEKEDETEDEKELLDEGVGGALIGGALGSATGKGLSGKVVGSVAGAIAGSHIQDKLAEEDTEETVEEGLGGALVGGTLGATASGGSLIGAAAGALAGSHIQNKLSEDDSTHSCLTIADVLLAHSSEIDACGTNEAAVKSCITNILRSSEITDDTTVEEVIRKINNCSGPKLWRVIGGYMTSKQCETDSSLEEDVNNVNVETDDSIISVQSEEDGKVTVSTECKELEVTEEEAISPVSDETISEIEKVNSEEVEDTDSVENTVDFDIEEVDETVVDELGESYLKQVYENVESFKTTGVSADDTRLVVEGIITFKSGTQKSTGFIFEAHSATSTGKVKFSGKNEHFSCGNKSFTLTGVIKDKKLLPESFTYNYRAKNNDGKSTHVYGTVYKK